MIAAWYLHIGGGGVGGGGGLNNDLQRGTRDSEIGVLLEPDEADLIPSTMGGKPAMVGKFAHNLRIRLWAEYLGVRTPSSRSSLLLLFLHSTSLA
jgi:phospholipase D1/2